MSSLSTTYSLGALLLDLSGDLYQDSEDFRCFPPGSGSDILFRHFMELVCAGLSKNPYMSSAKKVSTITWFQEYFEREENKEILVHAGYWQEKQAKSAS